MPGSSPTGSEASKKQTGFWAWLNSPLGIWFLTFVVLGSISVGYRWYEADQKKKAEKRSLLRKLDSEIALRLDNLNERLVKANPQHIDKVTENLSWSCFGEREWGYPEYKGVTIVSLVTQVVSIAESEDRPELLTAQEQFIELTRLARPGLSSRSPPEAQANYLESVRSIIRKVYIPRWQLRSLSERND